MRKFLLLASCFMGTFTMNLFGQSKTIVGIMPFTANGSEYRNNNTVIAIQDAVSEAFLNTKRFTLVEREKMQMLREEKRQQTSEEFIDGKVVEQSKSLGASYIVTGNIIKAGIEEKESEASILTGLAGLGSIPARKGVVSFNLKVINVETGEIIASEKFDAEEKGKDGFAKALELVKPKIKEFIKNNFKATLSIASVEDKTNGKLLIAGGSSVGITVETNLKIYEEAEYNIDGKRTIRKKELGKATVEKVEDESFSICKITTYAPDIIAKIENGAKVKCEIIQ